VIRVFSGYWGTVFMHLEEPDGKHKEVNDRSHNMQGQEGQEQGDEVITQLHDAGPGRTAVLLGKVSNDVIWKQCLGLNIEPLTLNSHDVIRKLGKKTPRYS
jgi:hypothetical protein